MTSVCCCPDFDKLTSPHKSLNMMGIASEACSVFGSPKWAVLLLDIAVYWHLDRPVYYASAKCNNTTKNMDTKFQMHVVGTLYYNSGEK